ncbi:hypothetical protein IB267_17730 [Ensifer sp. ENS09]|uniref:hypothetical protein n=1 Tax=Ensifer sp. ENS09 TaxID=2769263 RepID=UPI00178319FE|nr:hypothetical protein [Ensifer sp. ENS09]MBD9650193.1 hypothetical protein [Ensifer sp. ENS09]
MLDHGVAELGLIERSLAMAERHVQEATRHVMFQRKIVDVLEKAACDDRFARALFATFERSRALHIEDRNRLRKMRAKTELMVLYALLICQILDRLQNRIRRTGVG